MYTLFIDTHLYDINVVLYKDGNVYLHKIIDKSMNNNSLLVPTIMKCITNIKLNEIIVVNGPGSFYRCKDRCNGCKNIKLFIKCFY